MKGFGTEECDKTRDCLKNGLCFQIKKLEFRNVFFDSADRT